MIPGHEPLRWDVHDERRRDFWSNPVVPSWYEGSVGDARPRRQAGAGAGAGRPSERDVTVGADGLGIVARFDR